MAYSTRRYVKHIDKYDVTHRLEIQEDGFGGSEDSIGTTGQVFQFEHETHASEDQEILNVYENPVQKGSVELFLRIDNSTDRTLIEDIFNGDEDDFRLVWKIDGTVFWTGTILNDMLEYPESDYPYMAKLWAKDFSRLEGMFYTSDGTPNGTLPDTRQTLITTFADLIGELGYGLDIQTHTSWITQDTTDATDFLQQIYHETFALREYANSGEESDQPIKVLDALAMMCRNFGCVIRQEGNVFKIIQYSEYETPTSVNVTVYDSTGTEKTAASSTDLSLDTATNDITITDRSITRAFKGIKEAETTFSHRSRVGELTLPRNVYITGAGQESYSQSFISTGEQEIKLSGTLRAYHSTQENSGYADLLVRVGQYYFDGDNWTTTTTDRVRIDITGFPVQREDDDGTYFYYQGFFDISTPKVPGDATTPIEIEFENAVIEAGPDVVADETAYENIDFNIIKPGDDQANSATLVYRLTQSGVYSTNYDIGETLFGDGPAESSRSALRFSSATNDITSTSWQRRGTTSGYRLLHENLLKEIIDLQRGNRIRTDGDTLGEDYDPGKIITYRSKSLAYTGGQFDGKNGDWLPVLFEINVQAASDTFETIIKSTSGGVQGSSSTSSGGGSGGIDQSTADARYFKQASLLSEVSEGDLPTLYGNIGLDDGSADLDLNSLDINGSVFVDSSRNVSAGSGTFTNAVIASEGTNEAFAIGNESGLFRIQSDISNSKARLLSDGNATLVEYSFSLIEIFRHTQINQTLTINSQLLFTIGNEQLLSTDAGVDFVDLTLTDFLTVGGIATFNGAIDANSTANFEGVMTLQDNITADAFSAGFQGAEWQITNAGQAEFEDVFIRGGLTAYEAIINRVRYNFGNTVLSAGGGKVSSVSGSTGSETVVFEDPEGNTILPVAEGDLLLLQNWDLNRTTIIKRIWRKVSSITGTDVTLTKDGDMPSDTGSIQEGDELVVNGNDGTTANRDAIIFQSVTETTHPFIKIQDNINSFTDWGSDSTTQVLIGDLTDAPALSNGTTPTGIGFFAKGSAYLEGEIVASSGNIADWAIESEYITKGSLGDGRIEIFSDNSVDPLGAYSGTTALGIPTISLLKQDTDFSDRMYLMFGETFVGSSWTGRIGISMIENFGDSTPYFELSKDASTGDITANIAGGNFDDNRLWNYDSNGGLELNWTNQFLKMYEDAGTTARVTIDGDSTTLPTSATVRDSISGSSGAITSELTIVNYEPISGSWAPEETAGSGTSTFEFRVTYQGWDGSTWNTIETYDGSLAGSSVGISRPFAFQDLSGYTKFRIRIDDRNSSGGNWAFDSYSADQIKTETIITKRGAAFVGGSLYFVDIPKNTDADFNVSNLPTNSIYSDEKDGNGNWILKMKA